VHVDAEIVHHLGEGVDLFDTRKLGFVDHEDIDAVATEPLDMWREVCAGRDRLGAASMPIRLVTIPSSLRSPNVHRATSLRPWRSCQHSCNASVDLPAAMVP